MAAADNVSIAHAWLDCFNKYDEDPRAPPGHRRELDRHGVAREVVARVVRDGKIVASRVYHG